MNEKSRPEGQPSEKFAAAKKLASDVDFTVIRPHFPLSWAQQLIDGADGPVPVYGSREWVLLPDESRAKVAACVIAAENWRTRRYAFEAPAPGSRRARDIAEARRPRPGDHPGGPVPVWPAEVASDA